MKMWICRTEGNVLTLHQSKPRRIRMDNETEDFFGQVILKHNRLSIKNFSPK